MLFLLGIALITLLSTPLAANYVSIGDLCGNFYQLQIILYLNAAHLLKCGQFLGGGQISPSFVCLVGGRGGFGN